MPDQPSFGTFGRYTEPALDAMSAAQRAAYKTTLVARGQVPRPYKIWLQNADLETAMVPVGVYFQDKLTLSKAEREIVTNPGATHEIDSLTTC